MNRSFNNYKEKKMSIKTKEELEKEESMIESISIVNSGLAETVETTSIKEDVVLKGDTLKEVTYSNYSVLRG